MTPSVKPAGTNWVEQLRGDPPRFQICWGRRWIACVRTREGVEHGAGEAAYDVGEAHAAILGPDAAGDAPDVRVELLRVTRGGCQRPAEAAHARQAVVLVALRPDGGA